MPDDAHAGEDGGLSPAHAACHSETDPPVPGSVAIFEKSMSKPRKMKLLVGFRLRLKSQIALSRRRASIFVAVGQTPLAGEISRWQLISY
jgi:hypothetical protein